MSFTNLVQCLLKRNRYPDDTLALNALNVLTREIQYDLTQAFQLSRSLVDRHSTLFWNSRSYFDFLIKVSKLPTLEDLSKDLSPPKTVPTTPTRPPFPVTRPPPPCAQEKPTREARELEEKNAEVISLRKRLDACSDELDACVQKNVKLRERHSELSAHLERLEKQNTGLKRPLEHSHRETTRDETPPSPKTDLPDPSMEVDSEQSQPPALTERMNDLHTVKCQLRQLESHLSDREQSIHHLLQFILDTFKEFHLLYGIMDQLIKERFQAQQWRAHVLYPNYQVLRNYFQEQRQRYLEVTTELQQKGVTITDVSDIPALEMEQDTPHEEPDQETESWEMDDDKMSEAHHAILNITYSHYRPLATDLPLDDYILHHLLDDLKFAKKFQHTLSPLNMTLDTTLDTRSIDSEDLTDDPDQSSEFLKRIVEAAGLSSARVTESIVTSIVDSLKRWKNLESMARGITQTEDNLDERILIYSSLVKNIPLLTPWNVVSAFVVPFETLKSSLKFQKIEGIDVEENDWFAKFVGVFFNILQFLNQLEHLSTEITPLPKTEDWYYSFRKKLKDLMDDAKEWNRLYQAWLAKLNLPSSVDKQTFSHHLALKRDASHLDEEEALSQKKLDEKSQREYIAIENLIYVLYKHYFKLKLETYKAHWTASFAIEEKIKSKLDLLSTLDISYIRPNLLLNIYTKYVILDLNAAMGQDVFSDILKKDALLEKCMNDTMESINRRC